MELDKRERSEGVKLFLSHLDELIENDPELSNLHDAFESYAMNKYSLDEVSCIRTGGKGDCGIDFFSSNDLTYHIAQCKIPERDWLEAHPEKMKPFGPSAISDARDALNYLLGNSKVTPNDLVKHLFTMVASDKEKEGFSIIFIIIVFGKLNERAKSAFDELKEQYTSSPISVRLVLQEIDDIVDDFVIGSERLADKIEFTVGVDKASVLKSHDYCYFLGNSKDIFEAFKNYGWRLFDLNLRYEIRNSSVNGEIINSLSHNKTRRFFHHYNNGLIIVCSNYSFRDKDEAVKLQNAQIINGLQTVKSIYNAVSNKDVSPEDLSKDCKIQIKVIRNDNPDIISNIVQATNNQNPMSPRNLKSNSREQKTLRVQFANLPNRWLLQVKQGELDSLLQEGGRFFKNATGYPPSEFRPDPSKKKTRCIDNQDLAKAWLAFIGFSDYSGDQTAHYFSDDKIYQLAFCTAPLAEHWNNFANTTDFRPLREKFLSSQQARATQYLLAYFIWDFIHHFIPSPSRYREDALNEGVKEGKIQKSSGTITSSLNEQETYLANNNNYQTWKLMANMKEVLLESVAYVLSKRYGELNDTFCEKMLNCFEVADYYKSGDCKEIADLARNESDFSDDKIFSRIINLLHYVSGQFWEDKRTQINATSRVRRFLFRQDLISDFKIKINETLDRKGLDRGWKRPGCKFIETIPNIE